MAEQTESQVKAVDTDCFRLPDEGVLDVLRRKDGAQRSRKHGSTSASAV